MAKNIRFADKGKSFSWDSRMGGRVEHGSMYENEAKREAEKRKKKGLPPKKKRKTEYDNYLENKKKRKKPVRGLLEKQGYMEQQMEGRKGGRQGGQQQKGGLGGARSRKQNPRKATGSNPYA